MAFAIEGQALVKDFGNHRALDGVSFSVPEGSIYGFLGPNGAGKSTAIKIILGLISSSGGNVKVLGQWVRFGQNPDYLAKVGYLPQDPVFPEGLTAIEAMALVADIYRVSHSRIESLLEEFQLTDAINRKVTAYSRGMKQRLGIAAVLLTEPDLLILDEPVSALDPEGRRKVLQLVASLRGQATVFFSSHILADVERVCDRVAIVDKGRILMESDITDILQRYALDQYIVTVTKEHDERAYKFLSDHQHADSVERDGDSFIVTSQPGIAGSLSETVLPQLIKSGVIVKEFMPRRIDLEEVFFRVLGESKRGDSS